MSKISIPFSETGQFSGLVDDYLFGKEGLRKFYRFTPDAAGLNDKINQRKNSSIDRELLYRRLVKQYEGLEQSYSQVAGNIDLLKRSDTFTVTTGHQLNILTGPLYFIYKIATTIKLAGDLKGLHPACNFVPVFWMASEDHDFDEIRSLRVFGNQLTWESENHGAVGKFSTEGIGKVIQDAAEILGEKLPFPEKFIKAYQQNTTLSGATRQLVNDLFGKYGLVVIDGDDPELKRSFIPEMQEELLQMKASDAVERTNREFSKQYKIQVTPRDINLFYMIEGLRERIIREQDDLFVVNNTEIRFNLKNLLEELQSHPERFSPNVIIRPMYQEKILPNLAYIGGPGELNYWLQLADAFDSFGIQFPVLILRNCMMLLTPSMKKKMEKLNLHPSDIFKSTDYLTLKVLEDSAEIHVGTENQAEAIQRSFDELGKGYARLDPTLSHSVDAERQKILNSLKSLEEKARRLLKKKNETVVSQVKSLKESMMPGGGLQERTENILTFCNGEPERFVDLIISQTDSFQKEFVILETD